MIFSTIRFFFTLYYIFPVTFPYQVSYYRQTNLNVTKQMALPIILICFSGNFCSHIIIEKCMPYLGLKTLACACSLSYVVLVELLFFDSSRLFILAVNFCIAMSGNVVGLLAIHFFQGKYHENGSVYFGKCMSGDLVGMFFWIKMANWLVNPRNIPAEYQTINGSTEQIFPAEVFMKLPGFLRLYTWSTFLFCVVATQLLDVPGKLRGKLFGAGEEQPK